MDVDLSSLEFAGTVPPDARRVLCNARHLYTGEDIERSVDRCAVALTVKWQDEDPLLLAVLSDGLVLTGMLMRRLVFPLRHGSVCMQNSEIVYNGPLQWLARRKVIFVCAQFSAPQFRQLGGWALARGAEDVMAVALLAEPGVKEVTAVLSRGAQNVMGSGIAYLGYGANLPGLYDVSNV